MPTFDFRCRQCGETYSDLVPFSRVDEVRCPRCNSIEKERLYRLAVKGPVASSSSGDTGSGFT